MFIGSWMTIAVREVCYRLRQTARYYSHPHAKFQMITEKKWSCVYFLVSSSKTFDSRPYVHVRQKRLLWWGPFRCVVATICILPSKTQHTHTYRVSQKECARLREGVPYVKVYRYNPKHLCPKLNGYGDNGQRKVWSSCGSLHCTCQLTILSISVLECGVIWRQLSSR